MSEDSIQILDRLENLVGAGSVLSKDFKGFQSGTSGSVDTLVQRGETLIEGLLDITQTLLHKKIGYLWVWYERPKSSLHYARRLYQEAKQAGIDVKDFSDRFTQVYRGFIDTLLESAVNAIDGRAYYDSQRNWSLYVRGMVTLLTDLHIEAGELGIDVSDPSKRLTSLYDRWTGIERNFGKPPRRQGGGNWSIVGRYVPERPSDPVTGSWD